ncbi:YOL073C [Zygosaccharomyces parabailii]|uniref:BN860_10242g1_1 n=1 Tax=Zygosaccharomyces bailii (strain CLIB 213 / ATCC 58445 / CBS 680 / BCRC 21525 / NBRC 1098 / NCYC 1416 / NRRL Y-2227) TaxID=1333698 RepID=A0A8J2X554_ZYGB2|nr:YOL073C [Zygosaccharomyces parabailii]CDF87605.1 BN860_10242g1_1 [Zygosaccharomyces bailii CLIB 213]CDH15341.1 uncharacterized protein ZBAI_07128 [Zygosaccharomyces bailii ISA1307]
MSMETPTGLYRFPVTKICMVGTVMVTLIASVANCKYLFIAKYDPFISQYHQYYRLLIFQFGCVNETDMALLVLIWYQFRNLERLMGSYKYLSVVSLALIYTTVCLAGLNCLVNRVVRLKVFSGLTTGALPLVLAMFHFYKEYTPQVYEFEVVLAQPWSPKSHSKQFKWMLNDQFLVDALVAILLINQGIEGIICGFISWMCGVFLDKGLLPGMERWRLPLIRRLILPQNNAADSAGQQHAADASSEEVLNRRDDDDTEESPTNDGALPVDDENANDEPARPLGVQFLDTFRR